MERGGAVGVLLACRMASWMDGSGFEMVRYQQIEHLMRALGVGTGHRGCAPGGESESEKKNRQRS